MVTKIVPNKMSDASTLDITRKRTVALVARAERATGSRMTAYHDVARRVGMSASWVRKLVNGYVDREPRAKVYERIRENYIAFCERIEQENRADEQQLMKLRGIDASDTGTLPKGDF